MIVKAAGLACAMEAAAQTIRQCDGLPFPDRGLVVDLRTDGQPMVIVETDHAIKWADHLNVNRPLWLNTTNGDIEFRAFLNGAWWSILRVSDKPIGLVPTDKANAVSGLVQQTQLLPIVSTVR